jgi:hypothetical protein|tara:strand:- start:6093 stop:7664 length:1572 start_codon:yes stop_codon:yes gene_type:complete
MPEEKNADAMLAYDLAKFYTDPLGYVMYIFPWSDYEPIQVVKLPNEYADRFECIYGPDVWACRFLDELGREIKDRGFNGREPVDPIRFVTASGHGIGKSTLSAWLIKFLLDTRPFCKGTVTAVTADQLRTKTWSEVGKWHKLSLTSHWFDYNTGRGAMSLAHKKHKESWRADAQTCREENSEAFAGQHSASSTSFYLFDEASGIPEKIYEVREGGLTDGEPMVFDFGNPTRNSGRFYENCEGRYKHRFIVRKIDSRNVAITNKKVAAEMIEDYGEDSDIVRVRVKGEFPAASSAQFISGVDVDDAMSRQLGGHGDAPLILGVDVARQGDDESVIYPRCGNDARSFPIKRYSGLDGIQLAGKIIEQYNDYNGQGFEVHIFIDAGGGYGGSPLDHLRFLGYGPLDVFPGRKANKEQVYRYKSDELWGDMKDSIKSGLCLPEKGSQIGPEIRDQLTMREFGYTISGSKICLEPKSKMKDRGLASPDIIDALAITYAEELAPASVMFGENKKALMVEHEYNPLEGEL